MLWVLVALGTILQRFYHQRPGLTPSDLPSERSHYSSVSETRVTPEKATFRSASRDFRKNHVCFPIRGEIGFFHLLLLCEQSEENDKSGVSKHTCLYLSVSVTGVWRRLWVTHSDVDAARAGMWRGPVTTGLHRSRVGLAGRSHLGSGTRSQGPAWAPPKAQGRRAGRRTIWSTTGGAPSALHLLPSCRTCTHPHSLTPRTSAHHPVSLRSSADHFQLLVPEIFISPPTLFCPSWL